MGWLGGSSALRGETEVTHVAAFCWELAWPRMSGTVAHPPGSLSTWPELLYGVMARFQEGVYEGAKPQYPSADEASARTAPCLLMSRWTKQVTWPSPESVWEGTARGHESIEGHRYNRLAMCHPMTHNNCHPILQNRKLRHREEVQMRKQRPIAVK